MQRNYEYHGYTLDVAVEIDVSLEPGKRPQVPRGYVAVVRIFKEGQALAVFSPLRFGELGGRPFATDTDALMGGYSAARKIVDDLFSQ